MDVEVIPGAGADAPRGEPVCLRPARAVRVDVPARPRLVPLATVLVERRAAVHRDAGRDGGRDGDLPAGHPGTARGEGAVSAAARASAVRVVGTVAEVASGRRPLRHVAAICDEATYEELVPALRGLADRAVRLGPLRVCAVSDTAVEVSAVLHAPRRSRALLGRLERVPGGEQWRVRLLALL